MKRKDQALDTLRDIFALFGFVGAALLALASFSYWLFKRYSDKWLSAKFAERMANYKHAQKVEIEDLRFEINKLMDRSVKLHQREFDTLPEAWALLVEAHGFARSAVAAFQQYADVERMDPERLNKFLKECMLPEWEIDEICVATRKNDRFVKAASRQRIRHARERLREFHVYRLKHGIFFLPNIRQKFEQIEELVRSAVFEAEFEIDHGRDDLKRKARNEFEHNSDQLMKELEADIQSRLWSERVKPGDP